MCIKSGFCYEPKFGRISQRARQTKIDHATDQDSERNILDFYQAILVHYFFLLILDFWDPCLCSGNSILAGYDYLGKTSVVAVDDCGKMIKIYHYNYVCL